MQTGNMVYGKNWLSGQRAWLAAILILMVGISLDFIMAVQLPARNLSFGPVSTTFGFLLFIRLMGVAVFVISIGLARRVKLRGGTQLSVSALLAIFGVVNGVILAGGLYALYFEPFNLQITHLYLEGPEREPGKPLRIVHLTDLHVEQITKREQQLIKEVNDLKPDLILLTGDYLNIDYKYNPQTQRQGREVLDSLQARYGVYAVSGSPPVDVPEAQQALFTDNPHITVLRDETHQIELPGQDVYLIGIENLDHERDVAALRQLVRETPSEAYRILLYHKPDLVEDAAKAGIDLYLAGHTHGGQVRLPFYGAIITFSVYGKKYESGLFTVDDTTLYTSRGVGMEGLYLPRIRFLCSPEIVLIELSPDQ